MAPASETLTSFATFRWRSEGRETFGANGSGLRNSHEFRYFSQA